MKYVKPLTKEASRTILLALVTPVLVVFGWIAVQSTLPRAIQGPVNSVILLGGTVTMVLMVYHLFQLRWRLTQR